MLTRDQVHQFETAGYLVVEDLIPAGIMQQVRREYAELLDELYQEWFDKGWVAKTPATLDFWGKLLCAYQSGVDYFQPLDISLPGDQIHADTPFHIGPAVFDLLTAGPLLDVVEQLIGPEITSNPIQHVRLKPPTAQLHDTEIRPHITVTDWHQDRAVALAEADQTDMLTVWIAVNDATEESGCLQVQPQTSSQEMLPHCPKVQTGIPDGFVDRATVVPLPVHAGGVVLFHPLTPHASLENHSQGFRWSFDIRFNVTGQPTGRSHFPDFVARSRANPGTELRDWRTYRALWEDARARQAVAPHINIHRWTSDAPFCA